MATTNFYLKPSDKRGLCKVFLIYQSKGSKFKFTTKFRVKKENWNDGKLIKGNSAEVRETNSILNGYREIINEIEREALFYKREYDVSVIEKKFRLKIGAAKGGNDFLKLFNYYIDTNRSTKTISTIKAYKATLRRLKDYIEETGEELTFEKMNQGFYENFVNYMIKEHKSLNNTLGKHIKTVKSFLNFCIQNELISTTINLKSFKAPKDEVDIIYLTEDELFKILNLTDLPQHLEQVRDNFCFSCFTGLRFSDIEKLRNANIKKEFIEIRTEKTRDSLKIPISIHAKSLLNKWENVYINRPLPPTFSNQKTNEYLKMIAKAAEINEWIEIEKFSGAKKILVQKPKHDLISTHTARRTFVTLSLEKGIRSEIVMEITGHKKYQTFKRYIKITDKVKLIEMNKYWNIPNLKAI